MTTPAFSADFPDISARLAFSGNRLIRSTEHRSADGVTQALADPAARLLLFAGARLLMEASALSRRALFAAGEQPFDAATAVLLGHDDASGAPHLAAQTLLDVDALPAGLAAIDLRSVVAQGLFSGPLLGAIAQGGALLAWHRNNRFCARCGAASLMAAGGAKRHCAACGAEHFPRTDPVAIMMVVRGEMCLLGRGPHFPAGMLSCLAGFVEQGETIEDAVRRETREESGIIVGDVRYIASQPWPMPHSLMIGCIAQAHSDTIAHDATELELCGWFSRGDVRQMLDGTHPDGFSAPLKGAIAGTLMQLWVDGAI